MLQRNLSLDKQLKGYPTYLFINIYFSIIFNFIFNFNFIFKMVVLDQVKMNYPIVKQTELFADVCDQQNICNFTFTMPTTSGIGIGVIEITIYLWVGFILRDAFHSLKKLNMISYLWLLMTVLTGIWEFAFISQYKEVHDYADFCSK